MSVMPPGGPYPGETVNWMDAQGISHTTTYDSNGNPVTSATNLTNSGQQSIYDIIEQQLEQWGISDLGDTVKNLLTQGLSQDAVMVQLQQSDAYKQRFAGNETRLKNGLPVLSPADYVATEDSYQQVLRQYGINTHFATRDNFAKWIGNDVSATELQNRVQTGMNLVQQSDPGARTLLKQWYGVNNGDILATFLDPTQAQSTLDRKAFAANTGAELARDGFGVSRQLAESLYGLGTQDQVMGDIQNAGLTFNKTQELATRYGADYSAADALNQYVRGDTAPALIQQQLSQKEEAQFSRGAGLQSAGSGTSSGSF